MTVELVVVETIDDVVVDAAEFFADLEHALSTESNDTTLIRAIEVTPAFLAPTNDSPIASSSY